MKDCSQEMLEGSRPLIPTLEAINFCLGELYSDNQHSMHDTVAGICTYEELIGALLAARDIADD